MKEVEWKKIVERRQSCLFESFIDLGHSKMYWGMIGLPPFFKNRKSVNSVVYYDKDELKNYEDSVREGFKKNKNYFREFVNKGYDACAKLTDCAERIRELRDLSEKSREELLELFIEYRDKIATATIFLVPIVVVGRILGEAVKERLKTKVSEDKLDEYHRILTSPKKETNDTVEMIEFLSLVIKIKNELKGLIEKSNEEILKELEKLEEFNNYYEKHKWLGFRSYNGDAWTKESIIERIKHIINEDVKKKLENIKEFNKENERKLEEVKKELDFDEEFWNMVDDARTYVHFRTHRSDCMYKSGFFILNLYRELAKRMNLELQEVLYLTHEEITSFPEKMPPVQDIKERVKEYGSITIDGKRIVFQGKELEEFKKKQDKEEYNVDEVKGNPAFVGKVTGPARIVRNKTMLYKVEPGDVLVAVMTFPDFVPAMEKAVAFVTDEGGILCHAAIVSREMQKPCVVGTSIATKVFKDSEMIEVDAEKGIVRRLK